MEPNAEVLPKVPSKEKTEPGPEGVFEEKKPDEVVAKPPGVKVPDGKPPEEVKPRPEAKPDESKPPEEKKDESNEPATERRKSLPISKPNKGGVSTKASRAIAEMKANMDKKGIPMKKEGRKKKVLTLSQQMDAQMTVRDDQVFKAKMAQTIERWDEMVFWIKKVAVIKARVTVDERNLISCAYGNACKSRRESWRKITALELKERAKLKTKGRNKRIKRIMYFRHMIEKQIKRLCWEILGILDKHLITHAKSAESKVFFFKMQGDFYRYLAEITFRPKKRQRLVILSMGSYKAASKIGAQELPVTHPIRLATGLNYAVLWFDLMDNGEKASRITKNTFDLSIMELDIMKGVNEELIDCAADIMHALRDNITEWSHAFDPDWQGLRHAQSRFAAYAPFKGKKQVRVAPKLVPTVTNTNLADPTAAAAPEAQAHAPTNSLKSIWKSGNKGLKDS